MKKPLDTPTRIISPGRNPATLALSTPGVLHTIDSCQPFSPGSSIQAAASRQHASPQLKLLRSTSGLTQWRWRAASLRSRPASRTSTCLLPLPVSACFTSVFGHCKWPRANPTLRRGTDHRKCSHVSPAIKRNWKPHPPCVYLRQNVPWQSRHRAVAFEMISKLHLPHLKSRLNHYTAAVLSMSPRRLGAARG